MAAKGDRGGYTAVLNQSIIQHRAVYKKDVKEVNLSLSLYPFIQGQAPCDCRLTRRVHHLGDERARKRERLIKAVSDRWRKKIYKGEKVRGNHRSDFFYITSGGCSGVCNSYNIHQHVDGVRACRTSLAAYIYFSLFYLSFFFLSFRFCRRQFLVLTSFVRLLFLTAVLLLH